MNVRRVVTGFDEQGKAVFTSDGTPPRTHTAKHWPGNAGSLIWTTSPGANREKGGQDQTPTASWHPAPGGTAFMIVELPPDSVFGTPGFDGLAMGREQVELIPGLGERFAPDGMHQTETIDYGVILDGQLRLELEGGESKLLEKGDVVVQGGVRHAWRNAGDKPARVMFILVGA